MSTPPDRLLERVAEIQRAIASCHERRACPRCGAPRGQRCVRVGSDPFIDGAKALKHPHRERHPEIPLR